MNNKTALNHFIMRSFLHLGMKAEPYSTPLKTQILILAFRDGRLFLARCDLSKTSSATRDEYYASQ